MSRPLAFVVFLSVFLSIIGTVHYYIWVRLVRDLHLPGATHALLTALVVLLFASIPAAFYLSQSLPPDGGRVVLPALFSWLGLMFLVLALLATTDLLRLVLRAASFVIGEGVPVDGERRLALARMVAGAVAVAAGGMGATAVHGALWSLHVKSVTVRLARLPRELDGLCIVQLSDLHVGPTLRREFVEQVVRRTNELAPDVVAITGDLVDGSVERLRDFIQPLEALRARHGVFFVPGNHETYSGLEPWCAYLKKLGIRVLRNERVAIGSGEALLDIVGVDDPSAPRPPGRGTELEEAVAGRDPAREAVLLAHQPRAVHEAARQDIGLQLSGHTHGGQIWPWHYFVRLQQPVIKGLAQFGRTVLYVSSGTGFWGPPMRLGAPAEITKLVLRSGVADERRSEEATLGSLEGESPSHA